jgi:hypothetical protein
MGVEHATVSLRLPAGSDVGRSPTGRVSAGTYVDYECTGPEGQPGPAAGFTPTVSPKSAAANTCGAAGGVLDARLADIAPWTGGLSAAQTFKAPANTSIAGVSLARSTAGAPNNAPAGGSFLTYQVNVDDALIDGCLPSVACGGDVNGTITRSNLAANELQFTAGCGGTITNTCATPIRLAVTRAAITLRDDVFPVPSNLRGELFAPTPKSGIVNTVFDVADAGGGVYRTVTAVDNNVIAVTPAALGTCTDINPANDNPFEFAGAVPCPLSQVALTSSIDTTKLSDGVHTISIAVEDAAGNSTPVITPNTRFTVRNGVPNGSPAGRVTQGRLNMWFAANKKIRKTSIYGQRVVVRGTLRDRRGRGIRGAEIEVYHYVQGRPRLLKTGLRSRKYGRLTLILPMNLFGDARGQRRLAFYYRAFRPGAVTSKKNLYLTILNRRGAPQTK